MNSVRIHNALVSLAKSGPFSPVRFNTDRSVSVDPDELIQPSGIVAGESSASFEITNLNRRSFRRERTGWIWHLHLSFPRRVTCEAFEDALSSSPHRLAADSETGERQVLLEILEADYEHPPEHEPSSGTQVRYTLQATLSPA